MTAIRLDLDGIRAPGFWGRAAPVLLAVAGFAVLAAHPLGLLAQDWWNDPEAGHGLLLAPLALWLGWRAGLRPDRAPNPGLGLPLLAAGILLRYAAGLASELFTLRFSVVLVAAGLVVCWYGWRQLLHWWLPFALFALSIPIPELVKSAAALPLQFQASEWGAALLESRHVPVRLSGNIIQIPGRTLFVTEACSGLRSLTALLSLGVLIGGLWLRHPVSRVLLVAATIPVAVAINAVRVFLTGFLVHFVSPELGEGFMHMSEGWLMFVVAFALLGALAWVVAQGEAGVARWRGRRADA
ncbi:MAG TPA: exosortase/archaeosortase family protein [Gemmatimonadales bacterium]|nr:exosortase/archaeosortase family protein [Gemmatimonadales bacterium]